MEIEIFKPHQLPDLSNQALIETINLVCSDTGIQPQSVNLIFLSDAELCKIHKDFLDDASPTDVITFNLGDTAIEAEIYISIDMARQNSNFFGVSFNAEIHRLIIHGLLHLAGYDDHDPNDKKIMKQNEDRLVARRLNDLHGQTLE